MLPARRTAADSAPRLVTSQISPRRPRSRGRTRSPAADGGLSRWTAAWVEAVLGARSGCSRGSKAVQLLVVHKACARGRMRKNIGSSRSCPPGSRGTRGARCSEARMLSRDPQDILPDGRGLAVPDFARAVWRSSPNIVGHRGRSHSPVRRQRGRRAPHNGAHERRPTHRTRVGGRRRRVALRCRCRHARRGRDGIVLRRLPRACTMAVARAPSLSLVRGLGGSHAGLVVQIQDALRLDEDVLDTRGRP